MLDKDKLWLEFKINIVDKGIEYFYEVGNHLQDSVDESVKLIIHPTWTEETHTRLIYSPNGHDKNQLKKAQKYLNYILKKIEKENGEIR